MRLTVGDQFEISSTENLLYKPLGPRIRGNQCLNVICCISAPTIFLASLNNVSPVQCGLTCLSLSAIRLCSLNQTVCMASKLTCGGFMKKSHPKKCRTTYTSRTADPILAILKP
ncbi:unnamed protein product [Nesidiocoris tenuis]|uniref:Uncharacterized protein n=1 Tax=Nesidiocoris tenuis TaxID=355587 RepID=A0A6H5GY89_9HEMI|nr:unnamed protein product [Nesidiocoris tenuis]